MFDYFLTTFEDIKVSSEAKDVRKPHFESNFVKLSSLTSGK